MNKNFIITKGNIDKQANIIIKFNFQSNDYIIYYVDENEDQAQIFVSKLLTNTEGKKFIESVDPNLKSKLNNLVYNIVVKLITDHKKGIDASALISELENREKIKLSNTLFPLYRQEYLQDSSVAITTKSLIKESTELFNVFIKEEIEEPVWLEVKSEPSKEEAETKDTVTSTILPNNVTSTVVSPLPVEPVISSSIPNPIVEEKSNTLELPTQNPQVAILDSIVNSDPNLTAVLPNNESNVANINEKQAGFANTKYIIIGTVCLLLSVVVVIVAIILIKNK